MQLVAASNRHRFGIQFLLYAIFFIFRQIIHNNYVKKERRMAVIDLKKFVSDESGVETIEWIAILAVVAALIIVVANVADHVKARLSTAASFI